MNIVLHGVRVIDPASGVDLPSHDVWLRQGKLEAIAPELDVQDAMRIDLQRHGVDDQCVVAPALFDLHAHLREPGDEAAETVMSGAAAAAAGGYGAVVAMANTRPPIDFPYAVSEARRLARGMPVRVLQAAAVTRNLEGRKLVDFDGCAAAGAVAFTDDGRNGGDIAVLSEAIRRAARVERTVMVHPEDESLIASLVHEHTGSVTRCATRPAEAELRSVRDALEALRRAGRGRLHLQHVSTASAVELVAQARTEGLPVTAEATPHHLTLTAGERSPDHRVNPPLRSASDVAALRDALRSGVIDAIATDHAPHVASAKRGAFEDVAPGMIGLETALSMCLTLVPSVLSMSELVGRLTSGARRVLGDAIDVPPPALRVGEPATLTLFDPAALWTVSATTLRSRSHNTPLRGTTVEGRALLTLVDGSIAYCDSEIVLIAARETAHV